MGGLVASQTPFTDVVNGLSGVKPQSSSRALLALPEQSLLALTTNVTTNRCQQIDQRCLSSVRSHRFVLHSPTQRSIAYTSSIRHKPARRATSVTSVVARADQNTPESSKTDLNSDKAPSVETAPDQTVELSQPKDTRIPPADIVSQSQFWRQQLESSLGALSGVQKGPNGQEGPVRADAQNFPHSVEPQQPPPGSTGPRTPSFFEEPQSYNSPPFWGGPETPGPNSAPQTSPFQPLNQDNSDAEYELQQRAQTPPFRWGEMVQNPNGGVPNSGGGVGRPADGGLSFEERGPEMAHGGQAAGPGRPAQNSSGGTLSNPSASRRPQAEPVRRPASGAVHQRQSTPPSRDVNKVDRSELTKLRQSLNKKLSEANMYNRHLQREVSDRDKAVNESTLFLASLQTELQSLVEIAKEIAAGGTKPVTRKINGRYIQSHLATRLEELHSQLQSQLENVDDVQLREVPITWSGVAEDVKIMGSFDGWTRGQHLSPETTGSYTLFSSVVQLRPGRYEVKFVVDGAWQLAPSWPIIGEGLSANNLLVVD